VGPTFRASAVRRSVFVLALVVTMFAGPSVALAREGSPTDLNIRVVAFTNSDSESKVKIDSFAIRDNGLLVVTFASAKLIGPGLTVDVVVGQPTGAQTRTRLEVHDPDVSASMAEGANGQFQQGKAASGSVVGNTTVEIELPKSNTAQDAGIWVFASTDAGDRFLTPIFRLADLSSAAPGRLPSPWGWAKPDDPTSATNVPGVPVLDTDGDQLKVAYVRKAPKDAANVAAARVVDSIFIRRGSKQPGPAVVEIDEQTSSVRVRKAPADQWTPVDVSVTNPDTTTGTALVQKGSELTIDGKSLEAALGQAMPDDAWIGVTRTMFMADGNRIDFAGVAVAPAPLPLGQTQRLIQAASDPKTVGFAIGLGFVAVLLSVYSFWRWLRATDWWQFSSGPHRFKTFVRRRIRRRGLASRHR
jgi:hypothetical protein